MFYPYPMEIFTYGISTSEISKSELDLRNAMRASWEEHVAWTRMVIISIAMGLPDEALTIKRLLRNPTDMANVIRPFYGNEIANQFESLMHDHLTIAAELVKAAKAGDSKAAADAEKRWYANADDIATFLNRINPNWSKEDLQKMLYEHLRLTKTEAVYRLQKNYAADIATYDEIEKQARSMADALSEGIIKQFSWMFA